MPATCWAMIDETADTIDLPPEMADLAADVLRIRDQIKEREKRLTVVEAQLMAALGNHRDGIISAEDGAQWHVDWPTRNYKAQPERVTPAKPAYSIRQKSLKITKIGGGQ